MKFKSKYKCFISGKWIWKCRLPNVDHFFSVSIIGEIQIWICFSNPHCFPNPRYIFPGGRSMKTSQISMILYIAARVCGQHWHRYINMETVRFYVQTAINLQRRCLGIPDCKYMENMLIYFIWLNVQTKYLIQTINITLKHILLYENHPNAPVLATNLVTNIGNAAYGVDAIYHVYGDDNNYYCED